jgi:hypothetical protein
MSKKLCLLFLLIVVCQSTHGQFVEDFEDGDLTESPQWTGDLDRWLIEDTPGGKRLATRGLAKSDTLLLRTNAPSAYGTWNLRYGYRGGPLSNFNQVRVLLWSSTREPATAYYVLIGSNDRTIKLYASDAAFGERVLFGSAADDMLPSDSAAIHIRVEHDYSNNWRVWLDGSLVIEKARPTDPVGADGEFGLWIKHTAARGSDHWFDDIGATRAVESDITGPLMESVMIDGRQTVSVRFSEPVTTESACPANAYSLDSGDAPIAVYCPTGSFTNTVKIETSNPLPSGINRLTARAIADPSGNVTPINSIDFEMPDHGDPPQPRDLVINEIDFAPAVPESEFVEIYNRSPRRIDLSSIWLGDARSAGPITTSRILMEPGAYAVVTRDSASLAQRFPDLPGIQMAGWPTLNNSGDTVMLIYRGDTLDTVTYGPQPGGPTGSLERTDPEAPSDFPPNWIPSVSPGGATPGRINSAYLPDTEPPDLQFVEQTSATAVRAVFTEPLPVDRIEPAAFELNGRTPDVIAPGTPHYSTDYFLLFESVESGTLRASQMADASGNLRVATNSSVHLLPRPGELIINEIMFEPRIDEYDGLADQAEYVEIRNLSPDPVSVNQCTLRGPENEDGQFDTMPLAAMPSGIGALEYAVIVDHKTSTFAESLLARITGDHIRPLGSGTLGLRNDGSRIRLWCDGEEIDAAAYDPHWHHPHLVESRGVSLERISPLANASEASTWTSSVDPTGGTPGKRNSVAANESSDETATEESVEVSPSPFGHDRDGYRDHTVISYRLRTERPLIRVTVYDSIGRTVRHLTRGRATAREGSMIWDGMDDRGDPVSTGIYIVFLEATDARAGHTERHKAAVVAVRGFN